MSVTELNLAVLASVTYEDSSDHTYHSLALATVEGSMGLDDLDTIVAASDVDEGIQESDHELVVYGTSCLVTELELAIGQGTNIDFANSSGCFFTKKKCPLLLKFMIIYQFRVDTQILWRRLMNLLLMSCPCQW